jgi:ABC-type thiamin/hydroxymethylpyrimidine transport system permease subunit
VKKSIKSKIILIIMLLFIMLGTIYLYFSSINIDNKEGYNSSISELVP